VLLLEGVGDALQEQQAEDDMLILTRIHATAQGVGHLPQLGRVADVGGGAVGVLLGTGQEVSPRSMNYIPARHLVTKDYAPSEGSSLNKRT